MAVLIPVLPRGVFRVVACMDPVRFSGLEVVSGTSSSHSCGVWVLFEVSGSAQVYINMGEHGLD